MGIMQTTYNKVDVVGQVDVRGLEVVEARPNAIINGAKLGRCVLQTLDGGDVTLLLLRGEGSPG